MSGLDPVSAYACLPLLGLLAGVLTTIAGMGGGLVLLAAIAVLFGPHAALAWTAPALLLGNLHRVVLYRRHVDRRAAGLMILGAVPTAFAAGLLSASMPAWVLAGSLLLVGAVGLAKVGGWLTWQPSPRATVPLGAISGVLIANGGGSGVVIGPTLLARGLRGTTYVGTIATIAVALHATRLLAYGIGGMADGKTLWIGLFLALCIAVGNLLGDRLRRVIGPAWQGRVQVGALVLCMGLAVGALF